MAEKAKKTATPKSEAGEAAAALGRMNQKLDQMERLVKDPIELVPTGNGLIYERMSRIMAEMEAIGKDSKNTMQNYNFRGIDAVYNTLHGLFAKHQVFVTIADSDILREEHRTTKTDSNGNTREVVTMVSILKNRIRFTTTDGSYVETVVFGEGGDNSDKATNKAISASMKYGIITTFLVPTEDLDEGDRDSPEMGRTVKRKTDENDKVYAAIMAVLNEKAQAPDGSLVALFTGKEKATITSSANEVKDDLDRLQRGYQQTRSLADKRAKEISAPVKGGETKEEVK